MGPGCGQALHYGLADHPRSRVFICGLKKIETCLMEVLDEQTLENDNRPLADICAMKEATPKIKNQRLKTGDI